MHSIARHVIYSVIVAIVSMVMPSFSHAALDTLSPTVISIDKLNQDITKVIDLNTTRNPILEGSQDILNPTLTSKKLVFSIPGIIGIANNDYQGTLNGVMTKVQKITNRALGLLALICVIYIVYQGVRILMNFDDDKIQGEALGSIKTIAWVIIGIGATWFIVSTAFYVISFI